MKEELDKSIMGRPGAPTLVKIEPAANSVRVIWSSGNNNTGYEVDYGLSSDMKVIGTAKAGAIASAANITGLRSSTIYFIKLYAVNAEGRSDAREAEVTTLKGAAEPEPPENLKGTPGEYSVALTWAAGTRATSYTISYGKASGPVIKTLSSTSTSVTVTGLSVATSYYFDVRSVNSAGTSAAVRVTVSTKQDPVVPKTPTNFTATPGATSIKASWASAGTDSYVVTCGSQSAEVKTLNKEFTGLQSDTSYTLTVRSKNSNGQSGPASLTVRTLMQTPGTVRLYIAPTAGGLNISWDGAARATGYEIAYALAADDKTIGTFKFGSEIHHKELTGLQPLTTYRITAYATNASGRSTASTKNVTTLAAGAVPAAPADFKGKATNTSVTLTWSASANANRYHVTYGLEPAQPGLGGSGTTSATWVKDGFQAGATYWFQINAKNEHGSSAPSRTTVEILDRQPSTPSYLSAEAGISTIDLSWQALDNDYSISYYNTDSQETLTVTGSGKSRTLTGLTPHTLYDIDVYCVIGPAKSKPARITKETLPANPSIPAYTDHSLVSSDSVHLAWTASVGADEYQIIYYEGSKELGRRTTTAREVTITALPFDSRCDFKLFGVRDERYSDPATTSVTTGPATDTAPRSLRIGGRTSYAVLLEWQVPIIARDMEGYDISSPSLTTVFTTNTYCTFEGLKPGTTYPFSVIQRRKGLPAVPATIDVRLPDLEPPTRPRNLTIFAEGAGTARLRWHASTDNVDVTGYEVACNGGAPVSVSATQYLYSNLDMDAAYVFDVLAHDAAGNRSVRSSLAVEQILTPEPPSPPLSLKLGDVDKGQAILSWTVPRSDLDVVGYQVAVNGGSPIDLTTTTYTVSSLVAGVAYTFSVRARDLAGSLSEPSVLTLVIPPAVTGLVLSAISNGSATLSWDKAVDASVVGYMVRVGDAQWVVASGTTHSLSGLQATTAYRFQVCARDASARRSEPLTLDVDGALLPPHDLVLGEVNKGNATLRWQASGADIGYQVNVNGASPVNVTSASHDFSNLISGTKYTFSVRARASSGAVSLPAEVLIVLPAAPSGLMLSAIVGGSATLSWQRSSGSSVTGYLVRLGGADWVEATGTSHLFTGLEPGASYHFEVCAHDAGGRRSEAAVLDVDDKLPPAVRNLELGDVQDGKATLAWEAPASAVIVGYLVVLDQQAPIEVKATAYSFSGLTAGVRYAFSVRAQDADGRLSLSVELTVVIPQAPENLVLSPIVNGSATLSWARSSDASVADYQARLGDMQWVVASEPSLVFDNLQANTPYRFQVCARDGSGRRSEPAVLNVDGKAKPAPRNLELGDVLGGIARLEWQAPADDANVSGYWASLNDGAPVKTDRQKTYRDFDDLVAGITYTFKVCAHDSVGNLSEPAVLGVVIPPMPLGVAVSKISGGKATLSWDKSTETSVVGYQASIDGGQWIDTSGTSHVFSGLKGNSYYYFMACALDATGRRSEPAVVEHESLPFAPGSVTLGDVNQGQARLSWQASDGDAGIAGYEVSLDGVAPVTVTSTFHDLKGLTAGKPYTAKVRARSVSGKLSEFAELMVVIPAAPVQPIPSEVTDGSVTLNWTAAADPAVVGYQVRVDSGAWAQSTGTSHVFTGLKDGAKYVLQVCGYDASGRRSEPLVVEIEVRRSKPRNLEVDYSFDGVSLMWQPPASDAELSGYLVSLDDGEAVLTPKTDELFGFLQANMKYVFKVRAVFVGEEFSEPAELTVVFPQPATGLTLSRLIGTSATIGWDASTDPSVIGYQLQLNGNWIDVSGTSYTFNNVISAYVVLRTFNAERTKSKPISGNIQT